MYAAAVAAVVGVVVPLPFWQIELWHFEIVTNDRDSYLEMFLYRY